MRPRLARVAIRSDRGSRGTHRIQSEFTRSDDSIRSQFALGRPAALALAFVLLLPDVAAAKPLGCFRHNEMNAERIVRHGLRLREGANSCDRPPWNVPAMPLWKDVDARFGPLFARQTQVRKAAFEREFGNSAWDRLERWDGRIVMHFRHYPVTHVYCRGILDQLKAVQRGGWNVVVKQAEVAPDEVRMDYRPCP